MNKVAQNAKKVVFSRVLLVSFLLLAQMALFLTFILRLSQYFAVMYGCFVVISILVTLHIISDDSVNPMYKLAWIIPVLIFPLFGGLFYIMCGNNHLGKKLTQRLTNEEQIVRLKERQSVNAENALSSAAGHIKNQSRYIYNSGYPAFVNTDTRYLSPGEKMLEVLIEDLKSAKRYIYMEYFIIGSGIMWDSILNVLEQKAKEGVDVRIIYDSFGCLNTLPNDYFKILRQKGIRCIEFNPLIPVFTPVFNNRDHRKITAIDGEIGYMGGVNLADEYINAINRFGHWKDCAIRLEGEAVFSLSAMFAAMWNALSNDRCDYEKLKATNSPPENSAIVQPYSDSPLDKEQVGENIYLNMIAKAQKCIYICTPYLIIDSETLSALILAAKSGIDVRMITPHNGDKWYVHLITRSYYKQLISSGVKIYEYTPGFIHSKLFVTDDASAAIGTVNLDYRSLYLHFECGVWLTDDKTIADIKQDFIETLEKSELITPNSPQIKRSPLTQLLSAIIRLFAPMM